jgi:hypothetical protein
MQPCSFVVADGNYKTMGQLLDKLVEVIGMNNTCAIRHNGLIEYEQKKDK